MLFRWAPDARVRWTAKPGDPNIVIIDVDNSKLVIIAARAHGGDEKNIEPGFTVMKKIGSGVVDWSDLWIYTKLLLVFGLTGAHHEMSSKPRAPDSKRSESWATPRRRPATRGECRPSFRTPNRPS